MKVLMSTKESQPEN